MFCSDDCSRTATTLRSEASHLFHCDVGRDWRRVTESNSDIGWSLLGQADMHGRGPLASVVDDPTRTLTIDFCCDAQLGSSSARQIAASMIKVVA